MIEPEDDLGGDDEETPEPEPEPAEPWAKTSGGDADEI